MEQFKPLTEEQLKEVVDATKAEYRPVLEFVYGKEVVYFSELSNEFFKLCEGYNNGFLGLVAVINSKLWSKFNVAIYPVDVANDKNQVTYSIGRAAL